MTANPFWKNDEHDLYWDSSGYEQWVDGVESLTVTWMGDPKDKNGCPAEALLVVRMPTPIVRFENGDRLRVVHNPCGKRGTGRFDKDDIRLQLWGCAVHRKVLDSPVTPYPEQVAVMGVTLQLEGTLRLW